MIPPLVVLLTYIPLVLGAWKAFEKAGEPGWTSIIPVYNGMVMARIAGREEMDGLLACIPCVGIYWGVMIIIDFARAFGKDAGYAMGLIFLAPIFWPMLGFGDARYRLGRRSLPRSRRRDDYDEGEEDEPRPRRRPRYEDEDEGRIRRRPADEDRPRRRPVEDEDRPRRRPAEDEDRPRRRPPDDEDRPRRRPRRDEDDDY
jgi:hypothetical protein